MRPLGTITLYLPFMDRETSSLVLEVMEAAKDYGDFVKVLCDRVCLETTTELAAFFAVRHALTTSAYDCLTKISEKYSSLPVVRPFLFFASAQQGTEEGFARTREAADVVLATHPPEWLATEMYLLQLTSIVFDFPARLFMDRIVDDIEQSISTNPSLGFFRAQLCNVLSYIDVSEGNLEQAAEQNVHAQTLATECDDQALLADILTTRARYFEHPDRKKPRELLRTSGNILEALGLTSQLAGVIAELAVLEASCGAYSAAIDLYMEAARILELLGSPTTTIAHNVAALYNAAGDGESGLAWSEMAESQMGGYPSYLVGSHMNQAWSLALRGQLQEAADMIDSTREAVFKSGLETDLAWLYFVEGVLEIAQGDYSDATTSLEKALEIDERCAPVVRVNMCLYQLARAEVLAATNSDRIASDEGEGYWLARLEDAGRADDMPGVLGQALLLKAELDLAWHRAQEARTALQEASVLAAEPGLEFLSRDLDRLLEQTSRLP